MRPRFISGAICPHCGAVDKIQMQTTETFQSIKCVLCHYSQTRLNNDEEQLPQAGEYNEKI